jgi:uncharacterized membrane protein YgcG
MDSEGKMFSQTPTGSPLRDVLAEAAALVSPAEPAPMPPQYQPQPQPQPQPQLQPQPAAAAAPPPANHYRPVLRNEARVLQLNAQRAGPVHAHRVKAPRRQVAEVFRDRFGHFFDQEHKQYLVPARFMVTIEPVEVMGRKHANEVYRLACHSKADFLLDERKNVIYIDARQDEERDGEPFGAPLSETYPLLDQRGCMAVVVRAGRKQALLGKHLLGLAAELRLGATRARIEHLQQAALGMRPPEEEAAPEAAAAGGVRAKASSKPRTRNRNRERERERRRRLQPSSMLHGTRVDVLWGGGGGSGGGGPDGGSGGGGGGEDGGASGGFGSEGKHAASGS